MFRWEQQKSGEEWSCDRRILAAAAEFPPPLRLLIAERLELLAEMGRTPSEADMAATFAGFPPPEADVLLRLWLAFSYERLTAIAEWGEARPEMKRKMGEAQRYDMLAGLLTAAPQRPDSDWVETVMWLTNLLAEMPETTRLRLRRLIESEVGQFENDDQRSSEPAESVEPATAPRGRTRSEAEIADLVPYVSESVVDAVRDALRKVVLEHQDHSEMLDKLLPQLQKMPSRRSEALDWLDVELSRMTDDTIIELIGKMKRTGTQGLQLKPETGDSGPSDDRPPVEPATARRGRLRFAATAAAGLVCLLATSYGWATAYRDYHDESRQKQALERKLTNVELQYDLLMMYLDLALSGQLDDPEAGGKLREAIAAFKARVGQVEAELDGLPAADDGWPP